MRRFLLFFVVCCFVYCSTAVGSGSGDDARLYECFVSDGFISDGVVSYCFTSDGFIPDGFISDCFVAGGFTSDGFVPDVFFPDNLVSDGFVSDCFISDGFFSWPDHFSDDLASDGFVADRFISDGFVSFRVVSCRFVLVHPTEQLKGNERGSSLAKTLSNMGLYNMDSITNETLAEAATVLTPHSSSSQTLKVR